MTPNGHQVSHAVVVGRLGNDGRRRRAHGRGWVAETAIVAAGDAVVGAPAVVTAAGVVASAGAGVGYTWTVRATVPVRSTRAVRSRALMRICQSPATVPA